MIRLLLLRFNWDKIQFIPLNLYYHLLSRGILPPNRTPPIAKCNSISVLEPRVHPTYGFPPFQGNCPGQLDFVTK